MDSDAPIPCTKGSPFRPLAVPPGKPGKTTLLSKPMVACWHSHLQLIRRIVRAPEHRVSLVFEDDVDLEWDVEARLVALWPYLPQDWDIVFLGSSRISMRLPP
jgi:GR25 family glycosyltransferase involved in LPS biosynthesis